MPQISIERLHKVAVVLTVVAKQRRKQAEIIARLAGIAAQGVKQWPEMVRQDGCLHHGQTCAEHGSQGAYTSFITLIARRTMQLAQK